MHKFKFQLLADPGTQSLCQILGVAALYDPEIVSGTIDIKPHGQMGVQLKLKFRDPERAVLLLSRLKNLIGVRKARLEAGPACYMSGSQGFAPGEQSAAAAGGRD